MQFYVGVPGLARHAHCRYHEVPRVKQCSAVLPRYVSSSIFCLQCGGTCLDRSRSVVGGLDMKRRFRTTDLKEKEEVFVVCALRPVP